jgi:hypothetical protein
MKQMRKQCVQIKTGECGKRARKKESLNQYNSGRKHKRKRNLVGMGGGKEDRAKEIKTDNWERPRKQNLI